MAFIPYSDGNSNQAIQDYMERALQEKMRNMERMYQSQNMAMQSPQWVGQGDQVAAEKPAPKAEKSKHLNTKLLLTLKG